MTEDILKKYHILIADGDEEMAKVVASMLAEMGFSNTETVTSGEAAKKMLQKKPFDFFITEWDIAEVNGLELIKFIRRSPDMPQPTLPVIMLTGHAEEVDVTAARDVGINEFVVKPFTAKTLYDRIQRVIEHPRQYVVSPNYTGPSRRSKGQPPPGMKERRVRKIQPQMAPKDIPNALKITQMTRVWLPDFSLKYKLGSARLDSIVTEPVLQQAQAAVDAISDKSLEWIKINLSDLRELHQSMPSDDPAGVAQKIGEVALVINSRAGTFGYMRASEVAYMLYLFARNKINPENSDHRTVVEKHIDVLQVILGQQLKGDAGKMGEELVSELRKLATKFS